MSTQDTTWYIGPSGGLLAIPDSESATRSRNKLQSITQGATGARTVNTTGFRRSWSLSLEGLTRHDMGQLQALDSGLVAGPIRMYDPLVVNILPPRTASTFSAYGYAPPFEGGATGVLINPVTSDNTFPLAPRHGSFARAQNTSGGTSNVYVSPWTPIIPSTQYTFSMYMKPPADTVVTAFQKDISEVITTLGTGTQVASSSWVRFSMSVTPGSAIKELRFSFAMPNTQVQDFCGLQLERGTISNWVPGEGIPEVIVTDMPESDPYWFYANPTVNIIEL